MYEEFDEEVLRSIQKKVETLRNGKGDIGGDDVCVVTYYPNQTKSNSNNSRGGIGIMGHPLGNPTTASTDRYVDPKTLIKSPKRTGITDSMEEKEENMYDVPATLMGKQVHDLKTINATNQHGANLHSHFQPSPLTEAYSKQNHLYENPTTLLKEQQRKKGQIREPGVSAAPKHHNRVPQNQFNSQPLIESAGRMEEGLYDEDDDVFYEDTHTYQEKQLQ